MYDGIMSPATQNDVGAVYLKEITFRQLGGGYGDQFCRPYDISGNDRDLKQTMGAISEQWLDGARKNNANGLHFDTIGSSALSGVAGLFIAPTAETYRTNIAMKNNAWSEDRFIFWAIFETNDDLQIGKKFRYCVSGYTDADDSLGITTSGKYLDPNMRMFINSVIKLEITLIHNGYGGVYERCKKICHDEIHHSNVSELDLGRNSRNRDMLLRPTDVLDMCQTINCSNSTMMVDASYNDPLNRSNVHIVNVNNRLGTADKRIACSRTENNSSVNMLTNMLRGISIGHSEAEARNAITSGAQYHATDNIGNSVYSNAKMTAPIRETGINITGHYLLSIFRERMGYGEHPYIQYNAFSKIFPNATPASNDCRVSLVRNNNFHTRESESMQGASAEQIEAFRMATCVSNIMFSAGFKELKFIATNETMNGGWDIKPVTLLSIRTTDENIIRDDWGLFVDAILEQVLIPMSTIRGGYTRDLTIDVTLDLMSDIAIVIRLDGGAPATFTFPAFASASYSPMRYMSQMGEGDQRINNIASVMMELSDTVINTRESRDYLDTSARIQTTDRTITGARTRPSRFNL